MDVKHKKRPYSSVILTVVVSLAAGGVNGIIGTGGGIVLTYLFTYLSQNSNEDAKDHLASAMAVILPVSCVSLFTYEWGYFESLTHFFATAVPAAAGGLIGAFLSDKVKTEFLSKLFAVLVIYAGITMIF